MLLVNLVRAEMNGWFNATLAAVLAAARPEAAPAGGEERPQGPRVIDMNDLQARPEIEWLLVENYLVATDRCAARSAAVHTSPKKRWLQVVETYLVATDRCAARSAAVHASPETRWLQVVENYLVATGRCAACAAAVRISINTAWLQVWK